MLAWSTNYLTEYHYWLAVHMYMHANEWKQQRCRDIRISGRVGGDAERLQQGV
jgi:hypothetical protein